MEAPAYYGPTPVRPRLTVVKDGGSSGSFSALPHAVLFSDLTDAEVRVYAAVQSFAWGNDGECSASQETIAERIGKEVRTVRRLLKSLVSKGYLGERRAGRGQAKAYRCTTPESGQDRPVGESKRPKMATQAAKNGQLKRPKMATPIEEDEGKKILEEELPPTGVGAAEASDSPAETAKSKKSSKGTRCPESFPLEDQHFKYAAEYGYADQRRVREITDAFLSHHRFKGTVGKDWYAGWQGWIRKQREIDDDRASRHRNGSGRTAAQPTPRPASSKPVNVRTY